jgi:glycosyltransferase involved in cell wall biosynthesis
MDNAALPLGTVGRPRRVTVLASCVSWGGTEEVTLGLLQTLERQGHPTTLLDLQQPIYESAIRAAGLRTKYRHVPLGGRLDRLSSEDYERLLLDVATDICVLTKGAFTVRERHIDDAAGRVAKRYVVIEHLVADRLRGSPPRLFGIPISLNRGWYRRRRRGRQHLAAADVVICVSVAVHARLSAEFGDDWHGVVVHNGVDTDAFRFDREARRAARREWGVPETAFVFGFMGRFAPVKAADVALVEFAGLWTSADVSPFLVMAGDGPDRSALEVRAATLGVASHVRFPGWISPPARAATLSGFDVFLLPSRAEGLPLALLQAMAVSRPSIAFDVGGVGEALVSSSVGWLIPAGDAAAFGRAMRDGLTMTDAARARMGAEARAHVERHFHRQRQLERLTQVVLGEA